MDKSRERLYSTWHAMMDRCYSEKHPKYRHYGGRGLTVCDRWHTFANFHADMGDRPEGLTLDRINGNLGYSPENCRWATMTDQIKNRCKTIWITYQGETLCAKDWAKKLGINYGAVKSRLASGWDKELAITHPISASNASKFRWKYARERAAGQCSHNEAGEQTNG